MTISRKTTVISIAALVVASVFLWFFYSMAARRVLDKENLVVSQFRESDEKFANSQIKSLGENIANYLVQIEDQIDATMRNAALLLQSRAESGDPDDEELRQMLAMTGMNDLYLAGMDGRFYRSTEKASLGLSIFDIWDGYRMLVEGKSTELPSPIKIKVETGEIFKFTAIPKLDERGNVTGIIEAALDASTSISRIMQSQLQQNGQLDALYIIEHTGLVLTSDVRPGGKSLYKAGTTISDPEILAVAKDNRPFLKWSGDKSKVVYCIPVQRFGIPAYILYVEVNPAPYVQNAQSVQNQFREMERVYSSSILVVVAFSLGILLFVVCIYTFFIRSSLLKPIGRLSGILQNISEGDGDLTERIDVQRDDEIGFMASRFNTFVEKIKEIVMEAQQAGRSISERSSEILENLDNTYDGIKDISQRLEHVSANIAHQHDNTVDCERISQSLSRDIEDLSTQTLETVRLLERVIGSKSDGEEKISGLVDKNRQSVESNRSTAENIKQLNGQIADINRIVEDIKAIAKQTQLLALNASIEAARAGEHGRGFAVVAGEVNDLAVQSAHSALEIEKITTTLGQSGDESVQAVSAVVVLAEEQNVLVEEVREAFAAIDRDIGEMRATLENVSKTVETVERGKEQMGENIRSLSEMGADNGESAGAIEVSVESQVRSMKNIHDLSSNTGVTIENLDRVLGRFKVDRKNNAPART